MNAWLRDHFNLRDNWPGFLTGVIIYVIWRIAGWWPL